MILKAILTAIDNKNITLNSITELSLSYGLDSPAVQLSFGATVDGLLPNCKAVALYYKNNQIFFGNIDQSKLSFNSDGALLKLDARSVGGFALDNEACPATLFGANASTVFLRHLKKYGLSLVNDMPPATVPVFTIRKGMSDWDVFREFALRAYSLSPYVNDNTVYIRKPLGNGYRLVFDNKDKFKEKYISIAKTLTPYSLISKVIVRDNIGQYSLAVSNSVADNYGAVRERYIIPTSEFADIPSIDANLRIKASLSKLEHFDLEVPYLIMPKLNQPIELCNTSFGNKVLLVSGCSVSLDSGGAKTLLKLTSNNYM